MKFKNEVKKPTIANLLTHDMELGIGNWFLFTEANSKFEILSVFECFIDCQILCQLVKKPLPLRMFFPHVVNGPNGFDGF